MSLAGRPSQRIKRERLEAVATEHVEFPAPGEPGRMYYMNVAHDDDCPALGSQSMADCRCEPEFHAPVEVADANGWLAEAAKTRGQS